MKSRSHRLLKTSDTLDDWVDESWVVDCVCGVNFDDGEEMVDCDECGVWVHTRCSRYVKSEKLFACDKCKSRRHKKESEETEVAQLLVELPTKTLIMDNSYMSFPSQNLFQVWTEVPVEEKVHVHGLPGGDHALFNGVSSLFGPELWKCTGYVPKKFNHQYHEFPCWDNRRDDDVDDGKKRQDENGKHANTGADALFLLSKVNGELKTQVNGAGVLDMGPPKELERYEGRRMRKERGLVKPILFHSSRHKKDLKDENRKKIIKSIESDVDTKKRKHHFADTVVSVSTTSSDEKQSESNERKAIKVFKTDKQRYRHDKSEVDVQNVDGSRLGLLKEAKQMEENDGIQVHSSDQVSLKKEDGMTSSLIRSPMETSTMKHKDGHVANNNGSSNSITNGSRSNINNLEKADSALNGKLHSQIEVKAEEMNHSVKTTDSQNVHPSDLKLDISNTMVQDTKVHDEPSSASFELKKEAVGVSKKVQTVCKDLSHIDTKPDEPGESSCGPSQSNGPARGSKVSTVARSSSEAQTIMNGPVSSPKGAPSHCKGTVSTVANSVGNKTKSVKEPSKSSSSMSDLKSSHLSKSSLAPVSKKSSSDLKDSSVLSSSKTSSATRDATRDSGDSASSLRSDSGGHKQNKKSEKMSQLNRHHAPKNHPPHVTLSDEELALLLHQELNSSPRVPRVPRMRNAGSLPQLASGTSTSTLMKRTSSGVKDNGFVLRKKIKDSSNNTVTNSRELDERKKTDKPPYMAYSRRHDPYKNGSAKTVQPPASTTVSSGPSSSNEDGETGAITHRTLPALIGDIMSEGRRMTYEELCNAVLLHWPNLRKHNGERYAYSSHSQAVVDCLRNRNDWSRLVDRGPKTNVGRKRRKSEADAPNLESEDEDDYSRDRNTKDLDNSNGKRVTRKQRRLALQRRKIKDVKRRSKTENSELESCSECSEESENSDEEEMQDGRILGGLNEASGSSDEKETML